MMTILILGLLFALTWFGIWVSLEFTAFVEREIYSNTEESFNNLKAELDGKIDAKHDILQEGVLYNARVIGNLAHELDLVPTLPQGIEGDIKYVKKKEYQKINKEMNKKLKTLGNKTKNGKSKSNKLNNKKFQKS